MLFALTVGSALCGLISAASIDRRQVANASGFPIPANDPFYAPTNFDSLAPGTIIASRSVQTSIQGLLQLAGSNVTAQSYQVSYRTSGPAGEPLTAVTTVFVPTPRQANVLLAYNSPEDSASINCAPSYWYRANVNQTGLGQTTAGGDLFAITNILQQGWTVSAADYESNELAAFGIGAIAAHGVLDGIRAAIAFNSSGLSQSPNGTKVGMFGYSGGGQATGWAMQSQPSYAPELNVVGAALGGLPANLTANGIFLDGKAGAGFIPIVIASLAKYYAPLRTRLEAVLTDAGRAAQALANSSCTVTLLTKYANQFFINGTTYQTIGASILSDTQIQPYFEAQSVAVNASLVPKAPMYAVHCASDETVPIGPADVAYASWCRLGSAPITYRRDVSGTCSHVTEAGLAYPEFFAFLRGRFNGTAPPTSCSVTNRSLSANGSVPALSSFYGSYLIGI